MKKESLTIADVADSTHAASVVLQAFCAMNSTHDSNGFEVRDGALLAKWMVCEARQLLCERVQSCGGWFQYIMGCRLCLQTPKGQDADAAEGLHTEQAVV